MADTDPQPGDEQIISTIKLTGSLVSAVYEYLWGIDDAAPAALPQLLNTLQAVGKALSALRKYSSGDPDLGASVLQKLNARNGPVAECAAELGRMRAKISSETGDGGLHAMVEKGHIMPYIRQLEKHEMVFVLALQILQDQLKLSEAMEGYIQDTDGGEVEFDHPLLRAAQVLEKRKKSLTWLYSEEYESGFRGVQERSVPGTGEWLEQSPIFQNWMKGNHGFLHLWGRAIGGAGKTHISARIIHHIQSLPLAANYAVVYFFFAHTEPGQKQPKDVLRCLILQLACQTQHFVRASRVLHQRLEEGQLPPTFDKLSRAFIDTSKLFDRVFVVLDGLDEYEHRADFFPLFRTMATSNISLFVTTHPQGLGGQHSLLQAAKIDLSARAEDIRTYIQRRIEECPNGKCVLGNGANRDTFVSTLTECANGMFLYVHLAIRPLLQQPTVNHMFTELQKLKAIPSREDRYNALYTRATAGIRAQPKHRAAIALKILLWVVKAKQTLGVGALREAIAVVSDSYELNKLDLCDRQTMLDVCQDLITIDESSGKVRLVHHTARDCLRNILPADADYQMAVTCLTYLSYSTFTKTASSWGDAPHQSLEARLQEHQFYEYAAKHLGAHITACDLALTTDALVKFSWREGQIKSYLQVHGESYWGEGKKRLPLRMAVHVGHLPVVRRFLDEGIDPFTPDQEGQTVLHWAVSGNHLEIVRLLLDRWQIRARGGRVQESDLWCEEEDEKPVLHRAARNGFKELVKLFLEHGADISVTGEGRQTPLHEAAKGGHEDVVQLLLDNGADSRSKEECGETALHVAAAEGHLGIVTRLIEHRNNITPRTSAFQDWTVRKMNERCDVSAGDHEMVTPLHRAALGGHTKIVQLLLEEDANSTAQDKSGETVLHQAARGGDNASIQLLLDHGADVMSKNRANVTILHRAATRGYTEMIEIILDHGADISQRLGEMTALELALNAGHDEAVQLLLSKCAETPIPANVDRMLGEAARTGDDFLVELLLSYGANPSGTPLLNAAECGHQHVVKLLLDGGANVLLRTDNNRTVLQVAVKQGHKEVVKLALDRGAEIPAGEEANAMLVNAAGAGHRAIVELLLNHGIDTCGAALHVAAANGHLDVVVLLLARGTDIHFRSSTNQTVFHIAVYNGRQNVAELLLRHGADIHAREETQQTALHYAAYGKENKGHEGLVLLLLKAGADISVKDKSGRTPLISASRGGPVEVVRALRAYGADVTIQDDNGWTALHHAANGGLIDIVRLFSSLSAVRNTNNQTALVLAAGGGHETVVREFLPYSPDTEKPEDMNLAFFVAAVNGHHEATAMLLSHGASVKTTDKEGRTAFILAVEKGHSKILEILLRFNADISEKTKDGESALFLAARKGRVNVVRILLEKGANISETNGEGQTALFVAGKYRHREVYYLLIEKGVNQFVRDRHSNVASIEDDDDGYDYQEPWYPHGW